MIMSDLIKEPVEIGSEAESEKLMHHLALLTTLPAIFFYFLSFERSTWLAFVFFLKSKLLVIVLS